MKQKIPLLCKISSAALLAGLIILLIGVYYFVIKSGIPYQDPTSEMEIQWAIDHGIGTILLEIGCVLALCGGIVRLLFWKTFKRLAV